MYLVILLFVLVPAGVVWFLPSTLRPTWISVAGAFAAWAWIATAAYHSPISVNEPEWWGGLAISCTLAAIGAAIGAAARTRFRLTEDEAASPTA